MATAFVQEALPEWTGAESARERGAVFTPHYLANWVASVLRETSEQDAPVIADFGCGCGNLLVAATAHFACSELVGVDIDEGSVALTRKLLGASATVIAEDFLK